jgi:glycosyltransferase involved in cell wall biosynthesis
VIRPLLGAPHAEFLGEISDAEKGRFLGDAAALLFPVDWPEPFGLAMIEAMANGTPVIAMRRGAVPEIVDSGVTGFIVDDLAGALDALPHALLLDRARVRQQFERRFSGERMARDYVAVYEELQRGTGRCCRKASRVDADDIVPAA